MDREQQVTVAVVCRVADRFKAVVLDKVRLHARFDEIVNGHVRDIANDIALTQACRSHRTQIGDAVRCVSCVNEYFHVSFLLSVSCFLSAPMPLLLRASSSRAPASSTPDACIFSKIEMNSVSDKYPITSVAANAGACVLSRMKSNSTAAATTAKYVKIFGTNRVRIMSLLMYPARRAARKCHKTCQSVGAVHPRSVRYCRDREIHFVARSRHTSVKNATKICTCSCFRLDEIGQCVNRADVLRPVAEFDLRQFKLALSRLHFDLQVAPCFRETAACPVCHSFSFLSLCDLNALVDTANAARMERAADRRIPYDVGVDLVCRVLGDCCADILPHLRRRVRDLRQAYLVGRVKRWGGGVVERRIRIVFLKMQIVCEMRRHGRVQHCSHLLLPQDDRRKMNLKAARRYVLLNIRIMPLRKGVDKLFKTSFRNGLPSEHLCLDESAPKFCSRPMRRLAFVDFFP
nr:MAG TPA: hypothetical protein [Caudoviricetes sp.]